MTPSPGRSLALAILLLGALHATPAGAQNQRAARRHFQRGEDHYARGEWQAAYDEYEQAYSAAPLPGFLFNMGQCQRKLGRDDEALGYFRRYLEQVPDAPNRADAEALIAEIEAAHAPPPPPEPEPTPEPEPVVAPVAPAPAPAPEPDSGQAGSIGLPVWLLAAGGVVLLGVGGYFALAAAGAESELNDDGLRCERELDRCLELRDEGDQAATLRNVFLGVGGGVLAGAAVLAILDLSSGPEEPVAVSPLVGKRAFALRLRIHF